MWPNNVGILAIEYVGSKQYVCQRELEEYDGVPAGKYTLGLGQERMGFCVDREDINSLCLTVVDRLMKKQTIGYENIGRLEVGTETLLDKSKSVKTVLMQLFEGSGNTDVEGVDTTNACYGGTAALFNSLAWIESSAWDGRLALVVAGDIAVYAQGGARPTGGAGAVAMLIGPNAPLIIDRGARASHMRHVYDFYKPVLNEYPTVDGKLSIQCYLSALDQCYQLYCKKAKALHSTKTGGPTRVTLDNLDAVLFHSPYCKLVQKSLARLLFNDFKTAPDADLHKYPGLESYRDTPLEETYFNRDVEKASLALSKDMFEAKTKPSLYLANQVGNMYTGSLYGGLVSWLVSQQQPAQLAGKRVALFSYGSGLASSMYSLHVTKECGPDSPLAQMVAGLAGTIPALEARIKFSPQDFTKILAAAEHNHHLAPFEPTYAVDQLYPDTWYLASVDDKHRRVYKSNAAACSNHHSSALNNHQ